MSVLKATRPRRPVLAVLAAATLTLAGITAPSSAVATAATRTFGTAGRGAKATAAGANPAPVRRACPAAKPGDASCFALVRTNVRGHVGMYDVGTAPVGYGPADLQSAYALPSATAGSGQTVAVVDAYDDPHAAADLAIYRKQYGLPPCTTASGCFRKVNEKGRLGPYPVGDPGWAEEESLDLDMVSAICPRCHILLVEATSDSLADMGQAVDTAVKLGAKYVSNSYGTPEYSGETAYDTYYNHPGIAITAAAGDYGYNDQDENAGAPNWPATSEYVTAVGGTSLTRDPGTSRGWSEAAWYDGGSGCSLFEAKPLWQQDSGCAANHMSADVSAVADPQTGVAVYDSYSQSGWQVVGGTSVASPVIASVYALAGPPAPGSYPASYPYSDPSALNDITDGSNGTCTPAYWCNAGPGYDGPTGLGTPDGVAAFFAGQRGTLSGIVTSAVTGQPIADVRVQAGDLSVTTNSSGAYTLSVPAGTYTVRATDLGYKTHGISAVQVPAGQTVPENFTLRPVPTVTVSGVVADGSGHAWPLLARISVAGTTTATYTSPATGQYSLSLPENSTHTLTIDPVYPGYQQARQKTTTATASITQNITVPVDASTCTAPGYQYAYRGKTQTFNASTSLPSGWKVTTKPGTAQGWDIQPYSSGNYTGGNGNYASSGDTLTGGETSLYTPVSNLSKDPSPIVQFLWQYDGQADGTGGAYVDLSTDGGQTWRTVWQDNQYSYDYGSGYYNPYPNEVVIPLPQAAGKPQVQIRFRQVNKSEGGGPPWQLDNVFLGNRSCTPSISGGLLTGTVTDANTGSGITGADITSTAVPQDTTTTTQIPGDPSLGSGAYWMFSPLTSSQQFQATAYQYNTQTAATSLAANTATDLNFTLTAGQLTATPSSLSVSQQLGASTTQKFTLTNTSSTSVSLQLGDQPGGFTLAGQPAAARSQSTTSGWTRLPALPKPVFDNLVVTDPATGVVYSIGGMNAHLNTIKTIKNVYAYQPGASGWTVVSPLPSGLASGVQYARGAFVNGKIYLTGGIEPGGVLPNVWIYDPVTGKWSMGPTIPNSGIGYSSIAVLGGKIYIVSSDYVDVYDPATNTFSPAASYPYPDVFFQACGGLNGEIYCAGGSPDPGGLVAIKNAYAYDPASDTWSPIASLPTPVFDSAYTVANGHLLIAGGHGNGIGTVTNRVYSYTPGKGWAKLAPMPAETWEGSGACGPSGFYIAGGEAARNGASTRTTSSAEVLPGYSDCGGSGNDVPWLSVSPSTATIQPGQSITATVTLNAGNPSVTSVTQPGTYTAQVNVDSDTPYQLSVPVTMTVTPPKSWGEVAGTVTDASTGSPVGGATVQICTLYDRTTGRCGPGSQTYTLTTAADGSYGLWLDHSNGPVQALVTDNGYTPQAKTANINAGKTTTVKFALKAT